MRSQIIRRTSSASSFHGFTLLELLVTIAIVAILAALAAPSIKSILAKNAFYNVSSEFNGGMLRARNEAISKNTCVTICRSTTADDASPSCATPDGDWQVGWIIFLEPTCTSTVNAPPAASPENLLVARSAGNTKYKLLAPTGATLGPADGSNIQFGPLGRTNLARGTNPSLLLTSTDSAMSAQYGSIICIDPMGRTRTIASGGSCATQ